MSIVDRGFIALIACVVCILLSNILIEIYKHNDFGYFERGAHAVMLHHKYFGNYGSMDYRKRVFESDNDPQDSLDIVKLLEDHQ